MNAKMMSTQKGFTLLEVAVAGSVALMVIFGLFSAIRLANEQSSHIDKKRDERQFLSDLKYVLSNPVLCKGTMDLKDTYRKGEEIKVHLPDGKVVEQGAVMKEYGMQVDSFTVADAIQYSEVRSYERQEGCSGSSVERFEYQRGKLVRVSPPPGDPVCSGPLAMSTKSFYVDLDIQLSALKRGGIKFRPERLARLTVVKRYDKEEGEQNLCQAVNVVRVDSNVVTPSEFKMRTTALPDPSSDPVGFVNAASPSRPWEGGSANIGGFPQNTGGAGGQAGGFKRYVQPSDNSGYNPYEQSERRFNAPSHKHYGSVADLPPIDEAAEQAAKEGFNAREDYARQLASLRTAATANNARGVAPGRPAQPGSPDASTRPNTALACALNMSPEEAAEKGLPIVQHGQVFKMPLPGSDTSCEAKAYLCWEGKLQDTGQPPEKVACNSDPNGLSSAELARQAAMPKKKQAELLDCAVNRSLAEAKRLKLPTYRSGDRVSMPAGECLEKSYVCFDGSLRDEGLPAVPVMGCNAKAVAGVR